MLANYLLAAKMETPDFNYLLKYLTIYPINLKLYSWGR
jgi:hypothetical protein